ncbi:MAG: hypothetical protein WCJ75_13455 [Desulfomonile sp.]
MKWRILADRRVSLEDIHPASKAFAMDPFEDLPQLTREIARWSPQPY